MNNYTNLPPGLVRFAGGLILLLLFGSCKTIYYNVPDIDDYRIFPARPVRHAEDRAFSFDRREDVEGYGARIRVNDKPLGAKMITLSDYCALTRTEAFLIIRHDSIIYEYYSEPGAKSSVVNPFSITKAFVTTLAGIALREGKLASLDDPVARYLPEFGDSAVGAVTIAQLMKHCSGIHFPDSYINPFAGNAKYYYGNNLRKYLRRLRLYTTPGTEHKYSSANTQLLGAVLERAVGTSLSGYLESKLWRTIGMEYDANWSTDCRKERAMEKAFTGLNAVPVDLAKLGRLYLNDGRYDGREILSPEFVSQATGRDDSDGSRWDYQYNFGVGPEKYGSFYAVGLYGQLIYVYPEKEVIMVRIVRKSGDYNPPFVYTTMTQIMDQL
jgi:CubicO group peptidase (beta-lactamase class C family)